MAYTSRILVENFVQRALSENEVASLAFIIPAVKDWLDKRLNSTFDEVTPTVRYYDGGVRNLDIDPCTAITQVEAINDDASDSYIYTQPTEIVVEPQNDNVKREIRKRLAAFPRGTHRIAVTANFSEYDEGVPYDIQLAATRLAGAVLNQGKYASSGGNLLEEELEGHRIRFQPGAQNFDGLSATDPTVASILENRKELYVDNFNRAEEIGDDDGGGLLL